MEILKYLEQFMTEQRVSRMREIVDQRTRHITVVLEDIFQSHNISAVLRSCDCFGIQDVHILQGENEYTLNPEISLGSAQWLDIHLYHHQDLSTLKLFNQLKESGYKIVATIPNIEGKTPETLTLDSPVALIMGSELNGLSEEAIKNADEIIEIPMFGFTESFNISVATALILQGLRTRINSEEINWQLSKDEKEEILFRWYVNSIKESELIIKEFNKSHKRSSTD